MAGETSGAGASQPRGPQREAEAHEALNLVSLPIMGALAVLGLLGCVDTMWATKTFIAYVIVDSLWILLRPSDFPVLPGAILAHHAATLLLLIMPLRYPHLGIYTCWDGLAEINTFILVIRRRLGMERPLLKLAYWATFAAFRFVLYPVVLFWIWQETKAFPKWECLMTCGCQFALIIFNLGMLVLAYLGSRKKKGGSNGTASVPVAAWRPDKGPTYRTPRGGAQQSRNATLGGACRVLRAGRPSRLTGAGSVAMLGGVCGHQGGAATVARPRVPGTGLSQRLRLGSTAQGARPALGASGRLLHL